MNARKGAVTMHGKPLTLKGNEIKVGSFIPDIELKDQDLKSVKLSSFKGKTLLILSVPSLDTSVCSTESVKFNKEVGQFGNELETLVISRDLPFAQKRWCGQEKVTNIKTFSDYYKHDFGEKFGVEIEEIGLLARAIFIIDREFKMHYIHLVKEVTQEPPYDEILRQVKATLSQTETR